MLIFFSYFVAGGFGETARQDPVYQRFAQEHPKLAASLCDNIQNKRNKRLENTSESLLPFEHELYEAYKIIKSYDVSDEELFR